MRSLESLTVADFAALRGDRFRIAPDDSPPFDVEPVEATEIPREPGGRAPMEIFLAPIASDRYEAVFT